jgi:hypothetical protein
MALFFLNVHDGITATDPEGVELPDLQAAREEAIAGIRTIVAQEVMIGKVPIDQHIVITDENGQYLDTVSFEDAVTIETGTTETGSSTGADVRASRSRRG